MKLNEFVNQRRKELNMSVDELVKKSGIPKGTLSKITAGINSNPTLSTVEALCKALNCSLNDIAGNVQVDFFSISEKNIIKKYRILDEYGKRAVDEILEIEHERCTYIEESIEPKIEIHYSFIPASAGSGAFLDEENIEVREFPDTPEARQADIVIPVDGDSMEPMFHDGDELYVRLQPAVEIGEIGIFEIGDKGYVKKYASNRLISLNPEYDDIYPDEYTETKCVGKVIGKVE